MDLLTYSICGYNSMETHMHVREHPEPITLQIGEGEKEFRTSRL
jgi:hypothetical protein